MKDSTLGSLCGLASNKGRDVKLSGFPRDSAGSHGDTPSLCLPHCPLLAPASLPSQGPPGPVDSLQVGVAQVQLAAHQDDRCPGAEVLDLWVPHGLDMVKGIRVGDGEAQNHHVGPGGGRGRSGAEKAGRVPAPGTRENRHTLPGPARQSPICHVTCAHDLTQNV